MYQLRFVDRYRHLGTVTTVCNNDNAEVAIRSTILRTEARKLAKNILGNECITAKRRCDLATCYIWSKGLFQCGTWARLACPTYKRIHGAIMYVYRCIGKYQHNMYKSDDEIIAQLGVMCPKTFLRARRLTVFAKVVKNRTIAMLCDACSGIDGTWANQVKSDLVWLIFPNFQHACQQEF